MSKIAPCRKYTSNKWRLNSRYLRSRARNDDNSCIILFLYLLLYCEWMCRWSALCSILSFGFWCKLNLWRITRTESFFVEFTSESKCHCADVMKSISFHKDWFNRRVHSSWLFLRVLIELSIFSRSLLILTCFTSVEISSWLLYLSLSFLMTLWLFWTFTISVSSLLELF